MIASVHPSGDPASILLFGAAGRKARTARADTRAAELAPVIAELQGAGVASLHAIATVFNARGIPAARGGKWKAVQCVLARLK
jgi:hypothetical protein